MCGIFAYKGSRFSDEKLVAAASLIKHRGPDFTSYQKIDDVFLGFHRLSVVDLTHRGNQPFVDYVNNSFLVCNGEIYNEQGIRSKFRNYDYMSSSDCEVLLPLFHKLDFVTACQALDAEFALVYYDAKKKSLRAARDPLGIRPLFYAIGDDGEYAFASEMKSLSGLFDEVKPFPPGHAFVDGKFFEFRSLINQKQQNIEFEKALDGIQNFLADGVVKRLQSDAPIGFLLSGGVDSSLVCAIAQHSLNLRGAKIKTFSIGSNVDAIDNSYAEIVANHIGSEHTTVEFKQLDAINILNELIYQIESWDITTVRASIGMYLLCKWIKENTDIKVILTGEVSDELFGYKYTDFAPTAKDFQKEAQKRIKELHLYDVLRADRCISSNSLEARVPFGDLRFVDWVMSLPSKMKMNTYGQGKYLLRKAFDNTGLLPKEILFREKAAFSDAVGHSVVDGIKEFAETTISDKDFKFLVKQYKHCPPTTKEGLLYRKIFTNHFPNGAKTIPSLWLPNDKWKNCDVTDPSARVLPNYGDSGKCIE